MKFSLLEDEHKEHRAATIRGVLEGGLIGTGIALPTLYLLSRRSSYYRSAPFPIKVLGGATIVAPLVTIQAEKQSLEFERRHWTELCKGHLERREHDERERGAALSRRDKVAEWAGKHQLSVIMGSWATTMAVAGCVIMRDPLLTTPQKVKNDVREIRGFTYGFTVGGQIVQVRLWAQGLTIGVVIAAAALTHPQHTQSMEMRKHGDRFWQHALEDERLERDPHNISGE